MTNERLKYLIDKIEANNATKAERDEYMKYLYEQGKVSDSKYKKYNEGIDTDSILKYAVIGGLGLLAVLLIKELISDK